MPLVLRLPMVGAATADGGCCHAQRLELVGNTGGATHRQRRCFLQRQAVLPPASADATTGDGGCCDRWQGCCDWRRQCCKPSGRILPPETAGATTGEGGCYHRRWRSFKPGLRCCKPGRQCYHRVKAVLQGEGADVARMGGGAATGVEESPARLLVGLFLFVFCVALCGPSPWGEDSFFLVRG